LRFPILLSLTLLIASPRAGGMKPGIPRVTWTTDHYTLSIDERKQDLLPKLAAVAEECYAKQAAYFGFTPPERIQMVFLDEGDYANGYAYPPQEWVVIYMHSVEHQLRGRTRWLPGVIAHEVGHIFTLRRMGDDSRFLGLDLFHTWYGKANSSFNESFSWRYNGIPPWLAEGLAQYAAGICGYDTLDTHRQMVLRVAAASGTLLSLAELKAFAWDGRRNEMIYAQGYGLVSHLYRTYGAKAANHYLELAASEGWRGAFQPAFGKSLDAIYSDWRKALEERSHGAENSGDGDFILPEPVGPYTVESFPVPLAGNRFLYLSSADNDHGKTDLMVGDGKGGTREIYSHATSISPSADGRSAVFTSTHFGFTQGDEVSELYAFDAAAGSVRRLTTGGRILRGCEAGGVVYGIRNHEGRTSLVRIADGNWSSIWVPPDSLELTNLVPGRAPGTLTLGTTSGFGEDIRELDLATGELSPLAVSPQDERDPVWHGDTLYFSADYSGVFDIYALIDEQVVRLTHAAGGAFHPFPREDGIWVSAYGPKGFRLARARALGEAAPPFVVELPVPGWKPPAPVEYEGDRFDRTGLGLIGFNITLGIIRNPGYSFLSSAIDTAAGSVATSTFSYEAGTRALTGVSLLWQNPSGLADASLTLGLTRPLDYHGPMHLDQSSAEFHVNAFLPTLVVGGDYGTFDLPSVNSNGNQFIYYDAVLTGFAGLELLLSDHWAAATRVTARNDFGFRGSDGEKVNDSDPHFGGTADLAYSNLEYARDGVAKGFTGFARGEIVPRVNPRVPEYSATAGATAYASVNRFLFLDGSLYHTEDFSDEVKGWVYGGASAYCSVPLGIQLGTRGGAGLFLDRIQPGIEYRNMSRFITSDASATGSAWTSNGQPDGTLESTPSRGASPFRSGAIAAIPVRGFRTYSPRAGGQHYMLDRETSHEVGLTLTLKTIGFFAHPDRWRAGLMFDAEDFSREPMWTVSISL
jgi:hypothetical protein